ncbi:MAG TPA: cupin domain-containing protein [Polyangiaceae bacterium]|nr:cupin domain-containing protein [Polyangiaceae bacterium]
MLGSLTPQQFLAEHWQKKPLLVRQALPGFTSPLGADDLAGMACEDEIEARLVTGKVGGRWRLEHGPFEPERLESLPEHDWTLLVQDVDKWVPEVASLLAAFRFLPDWRIDDIMISVAAPGGSVGPHTDQYDVFLLQAQGRRRWQLSEHFDPALDPQAELKILCRFEPEQEFVVEPGDLLYLPPNVAHYGLALDRAMTYSIGFRAPDRRELMGALAEQLLSRAGEVRFADPGRALAERPSRIAEADLRQLRELVRGGLALGDDELDGFLCRYLTRPKPNLEHEGEPSEAKKLERRLKRGDALVRRPAARFLLAPRANALWLFADGAEHQLELGWLEWIEALVEGAPFDGASLARHPGALPLLCSLLGAGSLQWRSDADPESSQHG